MKILVAGFGNILRGDDGFGMMVSRTLIARGDGPPDVKIIEVGISGITLVQELLDGYDGVIILDAVDREGEPGTLYFFEPQVGDLDPSQRLELYECMADIHQTDPSKALLLAKALGVLPRKVLMIGCQPQCCDELGAGLSEPVQRAVERVLEGFDEQVRRLQKHLSQGASQQSLRPGMRVRINPDLCVGTGNCVAIAPRVFLLGAKGKARAENSHGEAAEKICTAARACPTHAIILEDEATGERLYP